MRRIIRLCALLALSVFLLACSSEKAVEVENSYTPRVRISFDQMSQGINEKTQAGFKSFEIVEEEGKLYLHLGDIFHDNVDNSDIADVFERYFAYSPNADFYGVIIKRTGVYGGVYENQKVEYFPSDLLLIRNRTGGRIAYEERWECLTFEDIVVWSETNSVPSKCYSFKNNK